MTCTLETIHASAGLIALMERRNNAALVLWQFLTSSTTIYLCSYKGRFCIALHFLLQRQPSFGPCQQV